MSANVIVSYHVNIYCDAEGHAIKLDSSSGQRRPDAQFTTTQASCALEAVDAARRSIGYLRRGDDGLVCPECQARKAVASSVEGAKVTQRP